MKLTRKARLCDNAMSKRCLDIFRMNVYFTLMLPPSSRLTPHEKSRLSSLSLSLSRFLLPFRSHRAYPLFRSKTETFLAFHTCFMGISRLGRKICKLNGINEKAEVPSFSFLSAHAGRRNALHYLNYPDLLSIPYEQRKTLSSESSRRENRANSC